MINKFILICMFIFTSMMLVWNPAYSQWRNNSVLTKDSAYFKNPKLYLSLVDSTKISSEILIDRTLFDSLTLQVNGVSQVTSINCADWAKVYNDLHHASYNTQWLTDYENIQTIYDIHYEHNVYCISLLDFSFEKIKQSALDNEELVENGQYLLDNNSSQASYSKHRAVVASCGEHNIVGDQIRFVLPKFLFFSNNQLDSLQRVEIDFGNGDGFLEVPFNEIIEVDYYSPDSEEVEAIVKLIYENNEIYYSHFSFYRTGTATVPLPDMPDSGLRSTPISPHGGLMYYPVGQETKVPITSLGSSVICAVTGSWYYNPLSLNGSSFFSCENNVMVQTTWTGRALEYCFLFSHTNNSGKLRRPFIIVDGFDPGNNRNYFLTRRKSNESDILPYDRDFRGLYQLLNGDPSPWYAENYPVDVNLIDKLRKNGYDIVFVNFIDGAGDIPTNAQYLRGFFNNVLNSPTYRDSQTEEAVLVGPSMGGIITRYALTSMEQANPVENHYVKTWISFDSPQKGAYIPISLQFAVDFLSNISDAGGLSSDLKDAKATFKANRDKLNTPAAKQMLLTHHTQTEANSGVPSPAPEWSIFYNQLDQKGYPKYSKNYAISNGGTEKLYPDGRQKILDFKVDYPVITGSWTWSYGWNNKNTSGTDKIFEGHRQGHGKAVYINNQIGYENAPGGWYAALYSMNCHGKNQYKKPATSIPHTKATFMVTASAFGIPVTRTTVYLTWDWYTGVCQNAPYSVTSPFDYVKGMDGENEEHVRISETTGNYLLNNALTPDITNLSRPMRRTGQTDHQSINGKVAYKASQTVELGGYGNSLTIKNGSEVTVVAGQRIRLLPGFKVEAGSKFSASISSTPLKSTSSNVESNHQPTKSFNYAQPSPFRGNVWNYSTTKTLVSAGIKPAVMYKFFPNPTYGILYLNLSELSGEPVQIKITDITGKTVLLQSFHEKGIYELDISNAPNGVYIMRIFNNQFFQSDKIIKL